MDCLCSLATRRRAPALTLLVAALVMLGAAGCTGAPVVTVSVFINTYRLTTLTGRYNNDASRFSLQPWFTGGSSLAPGDGSNYVAAAFAASSPDVEGV